MADVMLQKQLKPGDLIEVFRGSYQHWAIYIGEDKVVHLVTSTGYSSAAVSTVMALAADKGLVKLEQMKDVVGFDKFKINNLLDDKYEPREPDVIVRDAVGMVGRELPYSVTSSNCEHFVTNLRYGKPESRQVREAAEVGVGAVVGLGVAALGAFALYSLFKDSDDDNDKKKKKKQHQRR